MFRLKSFLRLPVTEKKMKIHLFKYHFSIKLNVNMHKSSIKNFSSHANILLKTDLIILPQFLVANSKRKML